MALHKFKGQACTGDLNSNLLIPPPTPQFSVLQSTHFFKQLDVLNFPPHFKKTPILKEIWGREAHPPFLLKYKISFLPT